MPNKEDISLIINCTYDDIKNIDISKFNSKYSKIYYNFNNNLDTILHQINTKYYSFTNMNNMNDKLAVFDNPFYNICISIVIPVYNCEKTIKKSLESCFNQDFKDKYEIIIVDDGSTDNTVNIIKSLNNPYVILLTKEHSGISDALNYGISNAHGKYICRMDGDDIMNPNRLSYQFNYLETHNNIDILFGNINRIYHNEKYKPYNSEVINKYIFNEDFYKYEYNFLVHPSCFFKKSLYDEINNIDNYFYDHTYDGCEDYELWLRLINKHNKKLYIDETIILDYIINDKEYGLYQHKKLHLNSLINKLHYHYFIDIFSSKTIGLYYIATGIYKKDFSRFLHSVKNFFPFNKKTIILLSDGLEEYKNYNKDNIDIEHHHINDMPWPIITLFKMKYMIDYNCNCDYIFYFNANSEILNNNYSWFDMFKLNVSYHKDWFFNDENPIVFCEPFMDNPNSTSYIGTADYIYVQAAFFGGIRKCVYDMCKEVCEMQEIDLINNIIPRYHDETYLNKYCYLLSKTDKLNLSHSLITAIWYDINDLKDLSETQFIILHENIYNLDNKKDKRSKFISFNMLKPLYQNTNEYNYKDYKEDIIVNNYGKSIILFIPQLDINEEQIYNIVELYNKCNDKYDICVAWDSRINPHMYSLITKQISSENIIMYDIIEFLNSLSHNINKYEYYKDIDNLKCNILYNYNFYHHNILAKMCTYKNIHIINKCDNNIIDNLINFIYETDNDGNDLTCGKLYNYDIYGFINNINIKEYNLFKYKYYDKEHLIMSTNYFKLSHRALEFLVSYNDQIKHEIYKYCIPTILNHYKFIVKNIE